MFCFWRGGGPRLYSILLKAYLHDINLISTALQGWSKPVKLQNETKSND